MNPADVAKYLRELAEAGPGMLDSTDRTILRAAANIVLETVENAIKDQPKGD